MLSQYSYGKFLVQKKLHEKMYTETEHLLSVVTAMLRSAPEAGTVPTSCNYKSPWTISRQF